MADSLVVVMGSDFARTNHYNSDNGKDHWPYGSFLVMEKNKTWTNRVVGETNDVHEARKINPTSLERDDANGTLIYSAHVHKALRKYLEIENSDAATAVPLRRQPRTMPLFA